MIKRYPSLAKKRAVRVRYKIKTAAGRPRLTVYRSLKFIYSQIIDDKKGVTLVAARGKKPGDVGAELGKKALAKKISAVVFDRGSYQYHGRVRELAEAVRKAGVKF